MDGRGVVDMEKEKFVLPHHRIPEPRNVPKLIQGSLIDRAVQFAQWMIPDIQDEADARLQHFVALYYMMFHVLRDV